MLALSALLARAACTGQDGSAVPEDGEVVDPPFEVRGDATGLLLVWYDEDGVHTAATREEIPAGQREHVRVDDLRLAPDERLDPELVYVADLSEAGASGEYTVRRMPRAAFDRRVEARAGAAGEGAVAEASAKPTPRATRICPRRPSPCPRDPAATVSFGERSIAPTIAGSARES